MHQARMEKEPVFRRFSRLSLGQRLAFSVGAGVCVLLLWSALQPGPTVSLRIPSLQHTKADARLPDVRNHTLGFERIFCLGLPSRKDHRDALELSAATTNITIDWIDGVTEVDNRSLPFGNGERLGKAGVGSWRAHLDALNLIVRNNISSALILEDDADWDVRIKQQMYDFALSSRILLEISESGQAHGSTTDGIAPLMFDDLQPSHQPSESPYGDDWDILWFGHCGMTRPGVSAKGAMGIPQNYVVQLGDPTVPEPRHMPDFRGKNEGYLAKTAFGNHTRLVHHPQNGFCSVAYAVSQRGARNMLWYAGIRAFDEWYDKLLPHFCEGLNLEGLKRPTCLTTQPQLFDQHVPRGDKSKESDIFLGGKGFRESARTKTVRWSTRMNLPKLLNGETDFVDQWPDSEA